MASPWDGDYGYEDDDFKVQQALNGVEYEPSYTEEGYIIRKKNRQGVKSLIHSHNKGSQSHFETDYPEVERGSFGHIITHHGGDILSGAAQIG